MIDYEKKVVAVEWCVEDVQQERPDLDDDRAFHVLETAHNEHDANNGINWDALNYWADYLYPQGETE